MSIFGEVMNPGSSGGGGRNFEDQQRSVARLIKLAGIGVVVLIAAIIFFNYVAAVTRIGA